MNSKEIPFGEFRKLYERTEDESEKRRLLNRRYSIYQEDAFRNFPEGWFDRFGLEFLEDMTNLSEVMDTRITIYGAFEFNGSLKVDMIGSDSEEFKDLLGLYSILSRFVCVKCGCIYGVRTSFDRRPRCKKHFVDDYDICAHKDYLDIENDEIVNGKTIIKAIEDLSDLLGDRYLLIRPIIDTTIAVRNVNYITGGIRREANAISGDSKED